MLFEVVMKWVGIQLNLNEVALFQREIEGEIAEMEMTLEVNNQMNQSEVANYKFVDKERIPFYVQNFQ